MRKIEREMKGIIESEGAKLISIEFNKHYKIKLNKSGRVCVVTAPSTPSDKRWRKNFRSTIRKIGKH